MIALPHRYSPPGMAPSTSIKRRIPHDKGTPVSSWRGNVPPAPRASCSSPLTKRVCRPALTVREAGPSCVVAGMMSVRGRLQRDGEVVHLVVHHLTELSREFASVRERMARLQCRMDPATRSARRQFQVGSARRAADESTQDIYIPQPSDRFDQGEDTGFPPIEENFGFGLVQIKSGWPVG
jgi:hypothetical protein